MKTLMTFKCEIDLKIDSRDKAKIVSVLHKYHTGIDCMPLNQMFKDDEHDLKKIHTNLNKTKKTFVEVAILEDGTLKLIGETNE